ncbi:prepilin peptidase [Phenylobacterium sp.]|jgi:leader peptidase (prepilin peptidase)/N-methyltransferase|uniref:prepilin peptidase n=1 Tax=Phenylobacterium sp. TaxID=1871053 RepID=UPI0037844D75
MPEGWLGAAAMALGAPVGGLIAALSVRLPQRAERPTLRRVILLAAAAAGLAAWAILARPGAIGVLGALLGWQLLLLAVLDLEHFWLPRIATAPLIASGLLAAAVLGREAIIARGLGAAIAFAVLAGLAIAYRKLRGRDGLGGGDAWLLASGGAWVGWIGLPSILIVASLLGLAAVVALKALRRPIRPDQPLPFGAALAPAIWLVWLYGPIGG